MPKVATVTVAGEQVEIHVNEEGRFSARYDDANVGGDTLQEVKDQLTKMNRQVLDQHAIDVTVIGLVPTEEKSKWGRTEPYEPGIGVVNAKYRGKHARTNARLLIAEGPTAEARKKFDLSSYDSTREYKIICRRISLDETMEYLRLAKAAEYAHEQLMVWIDARRLDLKKLSENDV